MTTPGGDAQAYFESFKAAFPPSRNARLAAEARAAFAGMSQADLKEWSAATAGVFGKGVWRRLKTLGGSLKNLGTAAGKGVGQLAKHAREGSLVDYLRTQTTELAIGSRRVVESSKETLEAFAATLRNNPREAGPKFVIGVFGFLLASGGIDADGGAPDLDLELGIDAHRSVFFHSFLIGAVFEAAIFGVASLMKVAYDKLPGEHDAFWDLAEKHRAKWAEAAADGVSAGVAYHLLVDAFIQSGSYHGIGVAMPAAAHAGIQAGNAAAEGLDVGRKRQVFNPQK